MDLGGIKDTGQGGKEALITSFTQRKWQNTWKKKNKDSVVFRV